jgi:hypothetical protein
MPSEKPVIRRPEMFRAVQQAASAGRLTLTPKCDEDVRALEYDAEFAIDVVANVVELGDVILCEPDDSNRPYHVMAFGVELEGEPVPLYVKVALRLPELDRGRLLSFHLQR